MFLILGGFIVFAIGGIWVLIKSFQESIWWGLGVMFVPFVDLVFLAIYWSNVKKPFGIQVFGGVFLVTGYHLQNLHL